jgi:hypothetical protein
MNKKIIGLIIIAFSLLSYGINISLAFISMYLYCLNERLPVGALSIGKFIMPASGIFAISVLIGIYVMLYKEH